MSYKKATIYNVLLAISFFSCQTEDQKYIPDVSDIVVDVKVRRFEKDLFSLDTSTLETGLTQLEGLYPVFDPLYFGQILGLDGERIKPEEETAYIKGFITHPPIQQLYDTCMVLYSNMDEEQAEFAQAFRFLKHYFPELPTPDITTFISEYTLAAFIYGENSLAVGLDFFLGTAYPYQAINPANPAFSEYMSRTFTKEHLVSKTMQVLVEDLLGEPSGERLLDLMMHNGKKLYILDQLLPYTQDSIKVEVTSKQMKWLNDNELEMWAYLLGENLLYSTEWQKIRKLVDYSPNSPGMPDEAPGRTANWLGWQIIKKYMRNYPETRLRDLIELRDAQQILEKSRYKPRR
ncbi:MAG: gliding motility lipoprotein GldB [Saprospiraceae bacterium]|nr:MAG: gliding motility lipoprotein GldB [Saprospiraceae bacterium]